MYIDPEIRNTRIDLLTCNIARVSVPSIVTLLFYTELV